MKVQAFIDAVKKGDSAVNSGFNTCQKAAAILMDEYNPKAEQSEEYTRLVKLGKKVVSDGAVALKHEADVWKYIGNHLLILMEPEFPVELTKKGGNVLIPANELKTVRDSKAAAKQIREAIGLSDGRANARGKKAPKVDKKAGKAVDMLASIASMLKNNDTRDAIFNLIVEAGFTKPRRKATK